MLRDNHFAPGKIKRTIIVLLVMILGMPWCCGFTSSEESLPQTEISAATTAAASAPAGSAADQTILLDPAAANNLEINGKAYVLYDAQSGEFLLGRNPDLQLSPASITKVMTILLALENLNLTDTITITREMYDTIPNDYVRLGLTEGEEISVENALYACLLISANDAAMALALKIGGSVAEFTAMMNDRALKLGCTGTHFTNPYGLAETDNLTTAHDMALILAEALKHDTYTQIATTKNHLMAATSKAGSRGMTNGNRFVCTQTYAYPFYIGGKTGFTNLSGHTIVAGANRDGRTLIGVILGATASEIRYANLITLFNHGFDAYRNIAIEPAAFDSVKNQTVSLVESKIREANSGYTIAEANVHIHAFATIPGTNRDVSFTCSVGEGPSSIPTGQSSQKLNYPLSIELPSGAKILVGELQLALQYSPTSAPASQVTQSVQPELTGQKKLSLGAILLRIGLILLGILLFGCLVLYIWYRRELKRRRQRQIRLKQQKQGQRQQRDLPNIRRV